MPSLDKTRWTDKRASTEIERSLFIYSSQKTEFRGQQNSGKIRLKNAPFRAFLADGLDSLSRRLTSSSI